MERAYFNSFTSRENYAILKAEAYELKRTVKEHISAIISDYVDAKRKENKEPDALGKDKK